LVPASLRAYPYDEEVRKSLEVIGLGRSVEKAEEEVSLPVDPGFKEFLRVASKYGAPSNIEEFSKLGVADKQYYLRAYRIYQKEREKMSKEG